MVFLHWGILTELHPASIHLYLTVTVILYPADGWMRACIMTSPVGRDNGASVGCTLMLEGAAGAIKKYKLIFAQAT